MSDEAERKSPWVVLHDSGGTTHKGNDFRSRSEVMSAGDGVIVRSYYFERGGMIMNSVFVPNSQIYYGEGDSVRVVARGGRRKA